MIPDGMIGCGRYDDASINHSDDWAVGVMSEILAHLSHVLALLAIFMLAPLIPVFATRRLSNTRYFDAIYLVAFLGTALFASTEFALRHREQGVFDG